MFVKTWGLIYKICVELILKVYVRSKDEKDVRKESQIYKNMRTHTSKQYTLYTSHTTWDRTHMDLLHIAPSTRPHSTIQGQCKSPHTHLSIRCKPEKVMASWQPRGKVKREIFLKPR